MCHFTKVEILFVNTYLKKTKIHTATKEQCHERLDRKQTGKRSVDFIFCLTACNSWKEYITDSFLGL